MNEVTIVGNLTADPTYRLAEQTDRGVVRFDVAVNRRRFDRESGEYADLPPVFHKVVAFGPLADNIRDSIKRGDEVVVVGSFADDSDEKDGEKRKQLLLEAQLVAASLRFTTADIKRVKKVEATPRTRYVVRLPRES
jgi:single-strand DNA-binding protein